MAGAEELERQLPAVSGLPPATVGSLENAVLGSTIRRQRKDEVLVKKRGAEDDEVCCALGLPVTWCPPAHLQRGSHVACLDNVPLPMRSCSSPNFKL